MGGVTPKSYGSVFIYKNGFRINPYGEPGQDILEQIKTHIQKKDPKAFEQWCAPIKENTATPSGLTSYGAVIVNKRVLIIILDRFQ